MKTSELTGAFLLCLILAGCGGHDKTMLLIDPVSGCQYVATFYGSSASDSYVKPVTDSKGKQRCAVPHG